MARLKSGNYQTNKMGIVHTVTFSNSDQLLASAVIAPIRRFESGIYKDKRSR